MKNLLIPLLALILFTACSENSQTIYLVRHAEKDLNDTTANPPLTDAGKKRAQRLVKEINAGEIKAIYSTKYSRNLNTVQPLADSLNLEISTYEWHNWEPMLDEIRANDKSGVVICGHGDNLLPMIQYLNGEPPQDSLGKQEYDKIFVLTVKSDTALVKTITY